MDAAVTAYPDAPPGSGPRRCSAAAAWPCCSATTQAVRRLEAALRLYRELDDPRGIAGSLQVLGSVAREQGRYARAMELHAESLAVAEAAGDRWAAASAHGYLAFVSWLQQDFGPGAEEASSALARFRDLGDVEGIAWSLISLGTIARYQGEAERAAALLGAEPDASRGNRLPGGHRLVLRTARPARRGGRRPRGHHAAAPQPGTAYASSADRWRMSSVLEDLAAITLALGRPGARGPAARRGRGRPGRDRHGDRPVRAARSTCRPPPRPGRPGRGSIRRRRAGGAVGDPGRADRGPSVGAGSERDPEPRTRPRNPEAPQEAPEPEAPQEAPEPVAPPDGGRRRTDQRGRRRPRRKHGRGRRGGWPGTAPWAGRASCPGPGLRHGGARRGRPDRRRLGLRQAA